MRVPQRDTLRDPQTARQLLAAYCGNRSSYIPSSCIPSSCISSPGIGVGWS